MNGPSLSRPAQPAVWRAGCMAMAMSLASG